MSSRWIWVSRYPEIHPRGRVARIEFAIKPVAAHTAGESSRRVPRPVRPRCTSSERFANVYRLFPREISSASMNRVSFQLLDVCGFLAYALYGNGGFAVEPLNC